MSTQPLFHHSRALNLDTDDQFDLNPLLGVFLQVFLVFIAAGLSWVYYYATKPTENDNDPIQIKTNRFHGYRNFDEKRDGAPSEPIYPGNPSQWYNTIDVPYFRLERLKRIGGGADIHENQQYLIAIADKVFDVTSGIKDIPHCPDGVDWSQLYGHSLNACVIYQDYTPATLTKSIDISTITPKQRNGFCAVYNHVYANYPIVGTVEGGDKYLPLLKNASKFDRPNFFW